MVSATLSLDHLLVIVLVTFLAIILFYITRGWIFRSRNFSFRAMAADLGLHFAFMLNCAEVGILAAEFRREAKIMKEHPGAPVQILELLIVDKIFLTVGLTPA
jgi:hypothetical protein